MSADNNLPPSNSTPPPSSPTPGGSSFPTPPQAPDPLPAPVPYSGGIGRFTKYIAIGAAVSGVASSIPGLSCLNLICCLLNMAGVALALHLYLKSAPGDVVSNGEAAGFGALAGAGAGVINGIASFFIGAATEKMIITLLERIDPAVAEQTAAQMASTSMLGHIFGAIVGLVLFTGFGALGGVLAMQLFFKSRLRK